MWRIILILSILLTSITAAGAANDDPFPAVASSYLLAIDGETVWAHRPERRLAPASLTKIMTALLARCRNHAGPGIYAEKNGAFRERQLC